MHPSKAVGRNEMPFRGDTDVVPCNIVLDRGPGSPTERGDLGVGTPVCSDVAYCQITLALVSASFTQQLHQLRWIFDTPWMNGKDARIMRSMITVFTFALLGKF